MRYVKRWASGVLSGIDALVAKFENHDALVTEALRELQGAAARAQVQLKRVYEDGEALRRRLASEREAVIQWRDRATRSRDDDQRAVECLRRSKQAERVAEEVEKRLEAHANTEKQLAKDVDTLQERIDRLKEQRNLMRTRQSRAQVVGSTGGGGFQLDAEIGEIFDRWETRVAEGEFAGGWTLGIEDRFEDEFRSEEENAALLTELEELRKENGHD